MFKLLAQSSDFNFDYPAPTPQVDQGTVAAIIGALVAYMLFVGIFVVLAVIAMWKVFEKAKQPGWAALVPIYNTIVLLEIVGRPVWWLVLMFIPFVNIVVWLLIALDLAKAFGKSQGFGIVGLFLFNIVGMLMLGFGDAKYVGAPNKPV